MAIITKRKNSGWAWGIFWLLLAALIMSNYFGGFVELSVWSMIIAALALAVLVGCISGMTLASIPIPIAALYYIFQLPLELPFISFWTLVLVTVMVTVSLHMLIPKRFGFRKHITFAFNDNRRRRGKGSDHDEDEGSKGNSRTRIEEGEDDDNPFISVSFGNVSRYLHSDNLKSAVLNCSFGAIEAYFDHVQLSPDGAEVVANCSFGSIEMYVPEHWRVIDNLGASLGSAEVDGRLKAAAEDAPTLTVSGNVSFGSIEVHRVRG